MVWVVHQKWLLLHRCKAHSCWWVSLGKWHHSCNSVHVHCPISHCFRVSTSAMTWLIWCLPEFSDHDCLVPSWPRMCAQTISTVQIKILMNPDYVEAPACLQPLWYVLWNVFMLFCLPKCSYLIVRLSTSFTYNKNKFWYGHRCRDGNWHANN